MLETKTANCRGSIALKTACLRCPQCLEEMAKTLAEANAIACWTINAKYRAALEEIAGLADKKEALSSNGWQPIPAQLKAGLIYAAAIAKKALLK